MEESNMNETQALSENSTELGAVIGSSKKFQRTNTDDKYSYINLDENASQQIDKMLTFTNYPELPEHKINLTSGNQIEVL